MKSHSHANYAEQKKRDRQIAERIKRANPSLKPKVTMSTTVDMNRKTSGITGVLEVLKQRINILDKGKPQSAYCDSERNQG